jgi:hypothetical protein
MLDESFVDEVVHVEEPDTVLAGAGSWPRRGFLFGGSTGTVVSGAGQWLAAVRPRRDLTSVAIAPDLGERYLDTVYRAGLAALGGRVGLRRSNPEDALQAMAPASA